MKVLSDILSAVDRGNTAMLALLDLLAAHFDTVLHSILLERLYASSGVRAQAHDRFRSYLIGRRQRPLRRLQIRHGSCQLRGATGGQSLARFYSFSTLLTCRVWCRHLGCVLISMRILARYMGRAGLNLYHYSA